MAYYTGGQADDPLVTIWPLNLMMGFGGVAALADGFRGSSYHFGFISDTPSREKRVLPQLTGSMIWHKMALEQSQEKYPLVMLSVNWESVRVVL